MVLVRGFCSRRYCIGSCPDLEFIRRDAVLGEHDACLFEWLWLSASGYYGLEMCSSLLPLACFVCLHATHQSMRVVRKSWVCCEQGKLPFAVLQRPMLFLATLSVQIALGDLPRSL